jgi:hypothetical protein
MRRTFKEEPTSSVPPCALAIHMHSWMFLRPGGETLDWSPMRMKVNRREPGPLHSLALRVALRGTRETNGPDLDDVIHAVMPKSARSKPIRDATIHRVNRPVKRASEPNPVRPTLEEQTRIECRPRRGWKPDSPNRSQIPIEYQLVGAQSFPLNLRLAGGCKRSQSPRPSRAIAASQVKSRPTPSAGRSGRFRERTNPTW